MLKAKFVAVKMDITGTSKKVRVKWRYVSPPVTSPLPHLAEETCWDSLPPEIQEMVVERLGDNPELFPYRLVNSSWKGAVDTILEHRSLSMWTKWNPIEPERVEPEYQEKSDTEEEEDYTGELWYDALESGVPELRPNWCHIDEHDNTVHHFIPTYDHPLPENDNPKLGTSIPTNSLRISFNDNIWPSGKRFEMSRRVQMLTDFVVKYHEHSFSYLKALLLLEIKISPSNLATLLRKLGSLKVLTLENAVLDLELVDNTNQEDRLLPPHQNLTHLRIISTNSSASEFLLNAYHGQLISLETNSQVPFYPKPYAKLERLKLITDSKPDLQFPQGEDTPFPALKYLSVIIHKGHIFGWDELSQSIDAFPKKLINLHFDFRPKWETEGKKIRQVDSSRVRVTFPNLKTLGIFFPVNSQHAECLLRLILPKFSNLQKIKLISCYWYTNFLNEFGYGETENDYERIRRRWYASEKDRNKTRKMVRELRFYAPVCPKLKRINII